MPCFFGIISINKLSKRGTDMPYESGGRADKLGNKYEFNWIVLKFIDIISEKIDAIKIEPIGPEGECVDVLVRYKNGSTEA